MATPLQLFAADQLTTRIVARSSDQIEWLRARAMGVTASDAARLTSDKAVESVLFDKVHGNRFSGNVYTEHGRAREPEIARWVNGVYGIAPSDALFHSADNRHHLATPDGLRDRDGRIELAEIKTTTRPWNTIPRNYLRQVWWQQYVLGAERTLVVWEQHDNFVPIDHEPRCQWVDRDEAEINKLIGYADELLRLMREA